MLLAADAPTPELVFQCSGRVGTSPEELQQRGGWWVVGDSRFSRDSGTPWERLRILSRTLKSQFSSSVLLFKGIKQSLSGMVATISL